MKHPLILSAALLGLGACAPGLPPTSPVTPVVSAADTLPLPAQAADRSAGAAAASVEDAQAVNDLAATAPEDPDVPAFDASVVR